ncbi:DMT family transporter [Neobacillus bataviensis]|uniref:DMT family transporter n=1 Tax=Neobacillus bataviensis TaxID=220685 RepID=UPI001CC0C62D|nr:DMT family transporter [Neobacillus bataviensis]
MGKLYTALIGLSIIWGTSFLFIKVLLTSLGPISIVFGRCLFGTIILFVIIILQKKKIILKKLPWFKLILVAMTNNVLPWLLICSSETKLTSSMASIINATTPIWTLIIGFIFFSSSLRKSQWIGIFVGFIGIFILSDVKLGELYSGNLTGILLMTGATFCYGLASHLTKKHLTDLSVLETSFFTLLISTIMSFIIVWSTNPRFISSFITIETVGPFIGLGALGSGIAYLLFYYLVKKGSPEFASLVTYLVPISAVFWGAMLLKENIHLSMIIGLAVIFIGVYIASIKPKDKSNVTHAA